jgi:hypothetical protein
VIPIIGAAAIGLAVFGISATHKKADERNPARELAIGDIMYNYLKIEDEDQDPGLNQAQREISRERARSMNFN